MGFLGFFQHYASIDSFASVLEFLFGSCFFCVSYATYVRYSIRIRMSRGIHVGFSERIISDTTFQESDTVDYRQRSRWIIESDLDRSFGAREFKRRIYFDDPELALPLTLSALRRRNVDNFIWIDLKPCRAESMINFGVAILLKLGILSKKRILVDCIIESIPFLPSPSPTSDRQSLLNRLDVLIKGINRMSYLVIFDNYQVCLDKDAREIVDLVGQGVSRVIYVERGPGNERTSSPTPGVKSIFIGSNDYISSLEYFNSAHQDNFIWRGSDHLPRNTLLCNIPITSLSDPPLRRRHALRLQLCSGHPAYHDLSHLTGFRERFARSNESIVRILGSGRNSILSGDPPSIRASFLGLDGLRETLSDPQISILCLLSMFPFSVHYMDCYEIAKSYHSNGIDVMDSLERMGLVQRINPGEYVNLMIELNLLIDHSPALLGEYLGFNFCRDGTIDIPAPSALMNPVVRVLANESMRYRFVRDWGYYVPGEIRNIILFWFGSKPVWVDVVRLIELHLSKIRNSIRSPSVEFARAFLCLKNKDVIDRSDDKLIDSRTAMFEYLKRSSTGEPMDYYSCVLQRVFHCPCPESDMNNNLLIVYGSLVEDFCGPQRITMEYGRPSRWAMVPDQNSQALI